MLQGLAGAFPSAILEVASVASSGYGSRMSKTLQALGFDADHAWDYENGYYLTSHPTRIAKLLAHFELYKMIVGLPGNVLEFGVYKGASLLRFATFRHVLESPNSRKIVGFDMFGVFPRSGDADDEAFIERFEQAGGDGISRDTLEEVFAYKDFSNVELVEGDILKTLPAYVEAHPELRVSLLHIDVDVYEPSRVILEHLADRVVPGGLIVLDDYATVSGETRAVDEFLAASGRDLKVEKLPVSHVPCFIRM